MVVKEAVWPSRAHTRAKHRILEEYLGAWFPILSRHSSRIVYIDGFAGPGKYEDGEEGSPVIALRTAQKHPQVSKFNEIVFWFIESEQKRYDLLKKELQKKFPGLKGGKTGRIRYDVVNGEFAQSVESALDDLEARGLGLAPTFAFLDPFGFKGLPMKVVKRILGYKKCEVMITFMDTFINRFHDQKRSKALNDLYGDSSWKNLAVASAGEVATYVGLYTQRLKDAGAKYTRTFQMRHSKSRPIYHLVYATKHIKGLEVAKNAMWNASLSGEYSFSDSTDPDQQVLINYKNKSVWGPLAA